MKLPGIIATPHEKRVGLACERVAHDFDVADQENHQPLPYIPPSLFKTSKLGKLLGQGQFCEVRAIRLKNQQHTTLAVKQLHSSVRFGKDFYMGATDLIYEAKVLNSLNHKNIIRLHGVSSPQESLSSSYTKGRNFSLYLESLESTLDERIESWMQQPRSQQRHDLGQRLSTVALPLARALVYLHSNNILYRDIKPQNIGFTEDGTLKLFDFGFAKKSVDDGKLLTAQVGTPVYMAPEVALSQPYGRPADVYSFGMVLFELCTLQNAFTDDNDGDELSLEEFYEAIMKGKNKPPLAQHSKWMPTKLCHLVESCWSLTPTVRPDFERIVHLLEQQVDTLQQPTVKKNRRATLEVYPNAQSKATPLAPTHGHPMKAATTRITQQGKLPLKMRT